MNIPILSLKNAIEFIRTIMFDILPDPIRRLLVLTIVIGVIFSLKKIFSTGGE